METKIKILTLANGSVQYIPVRKMGFSHFRKNESIFLSIMDAFFVWLFSINWAEINRDTYETEELAKEQIDKYLKEKKILTEIEKSVKVVKIAYKKYP